MARLRNLGEVLGDEPEPERTGPTPPSAHPRAAPPPADEKPRKFTMLMSSADDERAHRVVDDAVRRAGIRATKSMRADVVRALLALADEDEGLRDRVAARLQDGTTA